MKRLISTLAGAYAAKLAFKRFRAKPLGQADRPDSDYAHAATNW